MSTATPSRAPRPRWLPSLVGLVLLGLVGAVVAVRAIDDPVGSAPSSAAPAGPASGLAAQTEPASTAAPVPDDATLARSFAALERAVDEQDSAAFVAVAGSTAWSGATWRNLQALGIGDVDLRFVASRPGAASGVVLASVEVAWTPGDDELAAYDGSATTPREVTFAVTGAEDGAVAIVSAGSVGDRWVPAWLAGALHVDRLPGGAAVTVGDADATVGTDVELLTRRALETVDAVLPDRSAGPRRQVVVVAPATAEQAAQLLGRSGDDLGSVAALTTTVDGSRRVDAPVQVVLNPVVFDRLGPRGAQIVVSHEAVHAATGAAAVPMPLWVAEGFADWVALHDGSVPLDVAAGQFLASVRRDGPPRSLPSQADFDTQAHGLGTTYEAAWTIFRLLGKRVGDQAVIDFYEDVLAGAPVATALPDATGLDVDALTRAWRSDARRLARA